MRRMGSSKKTRVDRKGMVVRDEIGRKMVKQSQVRNTNVRSKGVVINHKYRSFNRRLRKSRGKRDLEYSVTRPIL